MYSKNTAVHNIQLVSNLGWDVLALHCTVQQYVPSAYVRSEPELWGAIAQHEQAWPPQSTKPEPSSIQYLFHLYFISGCCTSLLTSFANLTQTSVSLKRREPQLRKFLSNLAVDKSVEYFLNQWLIGRAQPIMGGVIPGLLAGFCKKVGQGSH